MNNDVIFLDGPPGGLRPYEKCELYGADALTDEELVAVVIKAGVRGKSSVELAREILGNGTDKLFLVSERGAAGGQVCGLRRLMDITEEELRGIRGIGRVKTIQILCLAELSRRIARVHAADRLTVEDPGSVADFYMEQLRYNSAEEVYIMMLTSKDTLISSVMISRGTVNSSVLSPREIFMAALKFRAAAMIMVHNHPSGNPEPSQEDIQFSRNLSRLGRLMNIPLRDSIIIGDNVYVSLLESGLLGPGEKPGT